MESLNTDEQAPPQIGINVPATPPGLTRRTWDDYLDLLEVWEPPPEGSQEAEEQEQQSDTFVEQQICKALQLDVLGRLEDGSVKLFSLFHKQTVIQRNPSRMSYEDFVAVCGPPAKACLLKSRVDDDVPGMYGVDAARTAVQLLAGYRMLSDEIELGPGCWQAGDDDEDEQEHSGDDHAGRVVIVGSREAAVYNGSFKRVDHPRACGMLLDFSSTHKQWYRYSTLEKNLEKAKEKEFRLEVYRESLELFSRWRWSFQEASPAILTGLCLATWVQHVWSWRPQVAIIGPSKAGKSMLCDALAGLFRGNCVLASDTTAAGLRQQIENSMPAVIVDEADPKDRANAAERQRILAMIRQSSRGGLVLRGSSSQRAVRHTLRHLFWIFGIQLPFADEADRNRVIMLELKLPKAEDEGKLHVPPPDKLSELGQRQLAVALWSSQRARTLASRIRDLRLDGIDSRLIESYAVPAAVLAVMFGFDDDENETRGLLTELLAEAGESDQPQPMCDVLIQEILSARIQIGGERPSVGQCLERVELGSTGAGEAEVALAGVGVKIRGLNRRQVLLLQYQPIAKHLLRGTRWEFAAIDQILRTIPEAERTICRIGGIRQRGISIPWKVVCDRYLDDIEE